MLLSGAEQLGKVIKTAEQRSSSFTLDRSFIDHPSSLPKLPPYLYGLMVFVEERRTSPNRGARASLAGHQWLSATLRTITAIETWRPATLKYPVASGKAKAAASFSHLCR